MGHDVILTQFCMTLMHNMEQWNTVYSLSQADLASMLHYIRGAQTKHKLTINLNPFPTG